MQPPSQPGPQSGDPDLLVTHIVWEITVRCPQMLKKKATSMARIFNNIQNQLCFFSVEELSIIILFDFTAGIKESKRAYCCFSAFQNLIASSISAFVTKMAVLSFGLSEVRWVV